MKRKWGGEEYINCCTTKERNGIVWVKAGIWKLRGIRKGLEEGDIPYI
jgi:hypothetical protein